MLLKNWLSKNILILGFCGFLVSHAQPVANMDESMKTVEKIKELEKRFSEAIEQTHPSNFEAQKLLLKEAFATYDAAIKLAILKPNSRLIQSVVKLANIIIDNDMTDFAAQRLYDLQKTQKLAVTQAISQLDANSEKKLIRSLKVRNEVNEGKKPAKVSRVK